MAETLDINANADRQQQYTDLLPQLRGLISGEPNLTANLANLAAALRQSFGFFWVGFYLVDGDELVLGPFQGDIACTRIGFGQGVCGAAWQEATTQWVPDVDAFPGHIACSSQSRSEVVVPVLVDDEVVAVLDIDSDQLDDFTEADVEGLQAIASLCSELFLTPAV
ncbi:diguanylate cyclase [Saccharospirillum sp. MSK14-1]|uniref:GAF domain-containing protein n=1 Tax=Saccharospirillum sp. MSK14-1 TaxID=1897632 RepID=UPI000D3A94A7|nr:GAF domain-containing protein [Saccharospirillum sp. MSK14-1]PTY38215.1 diguanylate cyclase [Saccharospirillum sp. MSK14-1]